VSGEFIGREHSHESEGAWIDQANLGPVIRAGNEVGMQSLLLSGSRNDHPSGHPEVRHPDHLGIKTTEQELSVAIQALDHPAPEAIDHIGRIGIATASARMPDLDVD
jgi:hypothetical protein